MLYFYFLFCFTAGIYGYYADTISSKGFRLINGAFCVLVVAFISVMINLAYSLIKSFY